MTRRLVLLGVIVAMAMQRRPAAAAAGADQVAGARSFMNWLADQAIAVLRRTSDSLEQREAAFRQLLLQAFDIAFIGRFVLGRHWRRMTAAEREDYLGVFSEFLVKTYSRRFGGYSGESFAITGAKPTGKKDIVVGTNIRRPSGPPIRADWRLRVIDRRYRIIDVSVEGISMALTQRTEFASVVQNHGVPGLLQALRIRTQGYGAKNTG